jgi:hypothetical protein
MIKWKYKPTGQCPVQAKGWFLGYYFYFRARWDSATIEFSLNEDCWNNDLINARYILIKTDQYAAGYLPAWKCRLLIWKGCIKFLFKKDKYKTV